MTQCELIVDAFKRRGWTATLGELLNEGQYSFAHKLTARLSDLRKLGYLITCEPGLKPTQNVYTMVPPFPRTTVDNNGQYEMFGGSLSV